MIRFLSSMSLLPWCILGDFNDMLLPDDKKGRLDHPPRLINGFRDTIGECNLIDLPLIGYPYTQAKSRDSENAIEERLDRAMITDPCLNIFPDAQLKNLIAPISAHSFILLCLKSQ